MLPLLLLTPNTNGYSGIPAAILCSSGVYLVAAGMPPRAPQNRWHDCRWRYHLDLPCVVPHCVDLVAVPACLSVPAWGVWANLAMGSDPCQCRDSKSATPGVMDLAPF